MVFVNQTWYSNLTDTYDLFGNAYQLYNFYDGSDPNSFQSALDKVCLQNAEHFGCTRNTTNCTAAELAAMQWGSYSVTDNPRSNSTENDYYMPKSVTLFNWTHGYPIPGIEEPLEYYYFTIDTYWGSD